MQGCLHDVELDIVVAVVELRMHTGVSSLHIPLDKQVMKELPCSSYPALQENCMYDPMPYPLPERTPFVSSSMNSHTISSHAGTVPDHCEYLLHCNSSSPLAR